MPSVLVHRLLPLTLLPALVFAANARAEQKTPHFVKLEYVLGPGLERICPSDWRFGRLIVAPRG